MRRLLLPLAVLLLVGGVAGIEFLQPIDQTIGEYQDSFGSPGDGDTGEALWFEVELDTVPSDGDLTLYRKAATSKTWTAVDTVQASSEYDSQYQNYYFNISNSFTISDGNSKTVTINGEEHTMEVVNDSVTSQSGSDQTALRIDGDLDNYDEGEFFNIDGQDVRQSDVIPLGGGDGSVTFQIPGRVQVPEFESSYRVEYKPDDEYSRAIYLSVDDTDETPYLWQTQISGSTITDYSRTGGIAPLSSIGAEVRQDQADDYNISLINEGTGDVVSYVTTGGADGTYLNVVKDAFYGVAKFVVDTSSQDQYDFPTSGSNLLDAGGQNEDYYFKIEDVDDNSERLTPVFKVSTTGTNAKPEITAIEGYDGGTWKNLTAFTSYGESLEKIRATVDDPNNEFHGAQLYLEDTYDKHVRLNYSTDYTSGSSSTYTWNLSTEMNASGNWTATVNVTDGQKSDLESVNWTVNWGNLSVISLQADGNTGNVSLARYGNHTIDLAYECVGGECASQRTPESILSEPVYAKLYSLPGNYVNTSDRAQFGGVKPGTTYTATWFLNETRAIGSTYDLYGVVNSSNTAVENESSDNLSVTVVSSSGNLPPEPNFTVTPTPSAEDENLTFNGSATQADGNISSYEWDWDDDGTYDTTGETAVHSYPDPGLQTVTLRVNDTEGLSGTHSRTLNLSDTNDPPNITYQSSSTPAGDRIQDWIVVNVSVADDQGVTQVIESFDGTNSSFVSSGGSSYQTNHTGLSTGNYTYKVYAEDSNGTWVVSTARDVRIETNEPVSITASDPDNITYSSTSVPVDILTSEPNGNAYSCNVFDDGSKIGETNQSSQSFKTTLSKSDGITSTISVNCTEGYGLTSSKKVTYSVDTSSGSGSGGGFFGGGGGTTIIRDVSGDEYSWTVSATTDGNKKSFRPIASPGGQLNESIIVANTRNKTVTLSLQCTSNTDTCEDVTLSRRQVELTANESAQKIWVVYSVPGDATQNDVYTFSIQVSDPEENTADVNFFVTVNPFLAGVINYIGKFAGVNEMGIPYIAVAFFFGLIVFGIGSGAERVAGESYPVAKTVVAVIVFLVAMATV